MEHTTRSGAPKILPRCTLPLTGIGVVHRIITELAVIDVASKGLVVREIAHDTTAEVVRSRTGASLIVPDDVGTFGLESSLTTSAVAVNSGV